MTFDASEVVSLSNPATSVVPTIFESSTNQRKVEAVIMKIQQSSMLSVLTFSGTTCRSHISEISHDSFKYALSRHILTLSYHDKHRASCLRSAMTSTSVFLRTKSFFSFRRRLREPFHLFSFHPCLGSIHTGESLV